MSWNQGHLLKSGQYEVIRLLGSGGFGMTYLAKDLHLERQVVIKRPNLSFEADRDYNKFLRRFKREGQVLAQVQIPNIVRVIEFTEIEGMPCLVMDFVAGETLNECIRRRQFIRSTKKYSLIWLMIFISASALLTGGLLGYIMKRDVLKDLLYGIIASLNSFFMIAGYHFSRKYMPKKRRSRTMPIFMEYMAFSTVSIFMGTVLGLILKHFYITNFA